MARYWACGSSATGRFSHSHQWRIALYGLSDMVRMTEDDDTGHEHHAHEDAARQLSALVTVIAKYRKQPHAK
jgi:hypothetical protein